MALTLLEKQEKYPIYTLSDGTTILGQRVVEDEAYRNMLARQCQTDLYWLAKEILGYRKLQKETHQEVADFFVQKDPDLPIEDQEGEKGRLLLLPRLTFKTTLNIADTVQIQLCWPDSAVLVMTASNSPDSPLADAFVGEVVDHFHQPPDSDPKLLHLIFPEHVTRGKLKAGTWISPARKKYRRDPSVWGVSIETSLSGWHPDWIKGEDLQDNRNSQTAFMLTKVRKNFYINLKMLPEWGHHELTGTRYGPADIYGHYIEKAMKNTRRSKVMWRSAMVVKPGREKILPDERTERDWILNFPRLLPYEFLMEAKSEDESSFYTQYMNIAEGDFKPIFPKEKLVERTVDEETLPISGEISIAWRLELEDNKNAAGAVGLQYSGRMFIVDIVRGNFSPSVLVQKIVGLAKKWGANRFKIEDTPGARSYEHAIKNESLRQQWPLSIQWLMFEQDAKVRDMRIKACEPVLMGDRMLFSDGIPNLQEIRRQLYHYGMIAETEVPDVIARVCAALPASISANPHEETEDDLQEQLELQQDEYDRVYNRGRYAIDETEEPVIFDDDDNDMQPSYNTQGLDDVIPGLNG